MSVRVLQGDCREVLATLPDASVQCSVTSPPYFGLRNYQDAHQVGIEETPDAYIGTLVLIFREMRRVLKDDGVLWLNLGDSYGRGNRVLWHGDAARGTNIHADVTEAESYGTGAILPNKQRLMIPARTAIALQADGWVLRDEIVWHKPRTTPFPAIDRTVAAHEMVYLLTKKTRYYFDYLAIEEPADYAGEVRRAGKAFRDLAEQDPNAARKRPGVDRDIVVRDTRRKRSVWSISPSPYSDGHFATMPPDLAEVCIRAGSREGDTILAPFGGAGTTALVADRLGRNAILIELNQQYCDLARNRLTKDAGLFAEVAA